MLVIRLGNAPTLDHRIELIGGLFQFGEVEIEPLLGRGGGDGVRERVDWNSRRNGGMAGNGEHEPALENGAAVHAKVS